MENKKANSTMRFAFMLIVGAVIIIAAIGIISVVTKPKVLNGDDVRTFKSLDEIKNFLKDSQGRDYYYGGFGFDRGGVTAQFETSRSTADMAKSSDAPTVSRNDDGGSANANDYSQTNIQVKGVDEPDIVKNDGKYIYLVNNYGNSVIISQAYPADNMKIVSEINLSDKENTRYVRNIFLNGNKLIVLGQETNSYVYGEDAKVDKERASEKIGIIAPDYYPQRYTPKTFVRVYDVTDRENPELVNKVSEDGDYSDARMIDDFVYVITTKYVNVNSGDVILPTLSVNGVEKQAMPTDIYYFPGYDSSYVFTNILALDINDAKDSEMKTYLTGYTSQLYVSNDNIYLTSQKRIEYKNYYEKLLDEVVMPLLPNEEGDKIKEILDDEDLQTYEKYGQIAEIIDSYSNSLDGSDKEEFDKKLLENLEKFQVEIEKEREKTVIQRISIDKLDIEYKGSGEVPGYTESQFSLDENDGYLRVATTTGNWRDTSLNHLYILDIRDKDMPIVGSVEDLAKGERIYSARFIGDRAYMVTFRQVDPLYVLDLSDPKDPKVLGYLKVTGYSDYLHPYDDDGNFIIGVGKEASSDGRAQGVKISLFDATDVSNPKEIAKYEIAQGKNGWSNSDALYDHKAFLFDREKELLVIPVSYSKEIGKNENDAEYRYEYWQGAFVFKINKEEITLRKAITHDIKKEDDKNQRYGWYGSSDYVKRSLFMEDTLYTISNKLIKASDLSTENVDEIDNLKLPFEEYNYPVPYANDVAVKSASTSISSGFTLVTPDSPVSDMELLQ
ncbi:hypothetical protein COU57_01230 [Candidatus Pacearchaeota archaeon CG10_big_fil_rev_8_21_14_0_10_32_14]|nr:MAG: hypothetical protein COU57_01230 [Candidatus Pacearchaeota archaeon CG10_big_fil_rev_8_21_14_0_10_32_14]